MKSKWLPPRTPLNKNPHDWNKNTVFGRYSVWNRKISFALAIALAVICLTGMVSGIIVLIIGDSVGVGLGLLLPSVFVLLPLAIGGLYLTARRLFWRA